MVRKRDRDVLEVVNAGTANENLVLLRDTSIISMGDFSRVLIDWYQRHKRDLPWRHTRDPWRILVSEVMLQQTRAAAVIPYYTKFLMRYPQPQDLAGAPEQELLTLWAGLGYYSRARNLQKAAREITALGSFPRTLDGIRDLPGVGDYTAAAVASFSFSLPHAVLDGNVIRVMARVTNDSADIGAPSTRKRLQFAVDERLDARRPALFNQAIMELGATLCLPKKPQCLLCPVGDFCEGLRHGRVKELPVKLKKAVVIEEARTLLVILRAGRVLLRQRPAGDKRLAGFYELPESSDIPNARHKATVAQFQHAIVNHHYRMTVCEASLPPRFDESGWVRIALSDLEGIPLSTMARKALQLYESEQIGKKMGPRLEAGPFS
jgi:A/G-specific adenine glycosylase